MLETAEDSSEERDIGMPGGKKITVKRSEREADLSCGAGYGLTAGVA